MYNTRKVDVSQNCHYLQSHLCHDSQPMLTLCLQLCRAGAVRIRNTTRHSEESSRGEDLHISRAGHQ
eukprot:25477-Eustigmatos_ZCMA.PRE.1